MKSEDGQPSLITNPTMPLFVTEGIPKADTAVWIDLCCIALLGVWNWRGSNETGGKTALADWESIALNGRTVFIVFDSDVVEKAPVQSALVRLKAFLESRKATVRLIYLPPGQHGEKVGLDDYIAGLKAAGNGEAQIRSALMALATDELRNPRSKSGLEVTFAARLQQSCSMGRPKPSSSCATLPIFRASTSKETGSSAVHG